MASKKKQNDKLHGLPRLNNNFGEFQAWVEDSSRPNRPDEPILSDDEIETIFSEARADTWMYETKGTTSIGSSQDGYSGRYIEICVTSLIGGTKHRVRTMQQWDEIKESVEQFRKKWPFYPQPEKKAGK